MVKIVKKHEQDFTIIQNTIFKFNDRLPSNKKLSFKAMGIFFYLWHLPHDWEFHESEITNHASDGIDKFRKGREELEKYGFVTKVRRRNKKGQVGQYEWMLDDDPEFKNEFLEKPGLDFPRQGNPKQEKPTQDNPTLLSTDGTKYLKNKVRSSGDDSKNSTGLSKAFQTYEQLWGFPNSIAMQDLKHWIDDYSDDLVNYAVEIAGRNNVSSYGSYKYLNKILTEWDKLGIKTVEDAKKQNEQHSQRVDREFKQRKPRYGYTPKKEELPAWAKPDDELTSEEKAEREKEKNKKPDTKRTHELEEQLKNIRSGELNNE